MREGQVEIARHGADHCQLLPVLLAETGDIGADLIEQFAHDRGDPVEMAGTVRAAKARTHPADRDRAGETVRIHRLDRRGPQQVCPLGFQHRRILCQLAGIGVEILVRAELGRVDEDRHRNTVGQPLCFSDKRQMPFVQRAHRGHQCQRPATLAQGGSRISQHVERGDGLHENRPSGR